MPTNPPFITAPKPIGLPGGVAGYFQILRPSMMKLETPGFPLAAELVAAIADGTVALKYGMMIGPDANHPSQAWKLVDSGASSPSTDYKVKMADLVGGLALPIFNTSYDPSTLASGSLPVVHGSWFDAETDNLDPSYTAPAVGDNLTITTLGRLKKGSTSDPVFAVVKKLPGTIAGLPGSASALIIEATFKGTAVGPAWTAP